MKEIIKVITIDDFKKYQPSWSSSFEDLQIQDGINLATNELIAFTNKLLEEVWEYNRANEGEINKSNPLYRTDKELNSLELAVLSQTYFKLMYGNDNSIGDASYSGGGVSISQSMSEHSYIAPDVYQHLIDARLFKKENNHKVECLGGLERKEPFDIIRNYPDPIYVPSKYDLYKAYSLLTINQNGVVVQSGFENLLTNRKDKILYTNDKSLTQWVDIKDLLTNLDYLKDVKVNGTSAKVDNQNVNIVIDGKNGIEVKQHANHIIISRQGSLDDYAKKDLSNTRGFKSLNVYDTNRPDFVVQNTTIEGINESYLTLNKVGGNTKLLSEGLFLSQTEIVEGGKTIKAPNIQLNQSVVMGTFSAINGLEMVGIPGEGNANLNVKLDTQSPLSPISIKDGYKLDLDKDKLLTFINENYKIRKVIDWDNQVILQGSISGSQFTYTNNSDNDYFIQGGSVKLISDLASWTHCLINDKLIFNNSFPSKKGFGYTTNSIQLNKGETIKFQWDSSEINWNDFINNVPVLRAYGYKYIVESK